MAGFFREVLVARDRNRLITTARASNTPRTSPVANRESPPHREVQEDLLVVEQLLDLALAAIEQKTPDVKLADILKLLEFKYRIKPESDAQAMFWEWIERFRREAAVKENNKERKSRIL